MPRFTVSWHVLFRPLMIVSLVLGWGLLPSQVAQSLVQTTEAAAAAATPVLSVPNAANGVLLAPRQSVLLTAQVLVGGAIPHSQYTVTFLAPAGVGGSFGGKLFARVHTNRQGMAGVRFTAGSRHAVYLVDTLIEGTVAATTFAVTVAPSPQHPRLDAAHARLAAQTALHLSGTEASSRLYGPVLLDAGSLLGTPGSGARGQPLGPARMSQATWLFWSDDQPGFDFTHPTRFVLENAGASPTAARVTKQLWWPVILLPGGHAVIDLRPASATTALAGTTVRSVAAALMQETGDSCAIVVSGDTDWSHLDDARNMAAALQAQGMTVYTTPGGRAATFSDLQDLIKRVENNTQCKKVFLYLGAHGYQVTQTSMGGIVMQSAPNNWFNDYAYVDYWRIADALTTLRDRGMQFTVVVDACYSGAAATILKDFGITGTVLTSADGAHTSYFRLWIQPASGAMFTNALIAALKDAPSTVLKDGMIDPQAIMQWVRTVYVKHYLRGFFYTGSLFGPNPQAVTVTAHPLQNLPMAPVRAGGPGEATVVTVVRPPGVPTNVTISLQLDITNTGVATFEKGKQQIQVYLEAGVDQVSIPVIGVDNGATTINVLGYDIFTPGKLYLDSTSVTVGSTIQVHDITVKRGTTIRTYIGVGGAMGHYLQDGMYPVASIYLEGYDKSIASIRGFAETGDTLHLQKPNTTSDFWVTGYKIGTTVVHASAYMPRHPNDDLWVRDVTFRINVVDELPTVSFTNTEIFNTTPVTPTGPISPSTSPGTQSSALLATPSSLEFKAVVGGDPDSQAFVLTNQTDSPITITGVLVTGPFSMSTTSSCHAGSRLPGKGQNCIGHVWFTPTAPGEYMQDLQVTYVTADGTAHTTSIHLDGIAQGTLPGAGGSQPTSTPAIQLPPTNTPGTQAPPPAPPTNTATSTPPPAPTNIPTATPTYTPLPTATTIPSATPTYTPVPRVSLGISTNSVNFGYVAVGTSSGSQSVTITNTGNAALTLSNLQVMGAQAGDFQLGSTACASLAPGTSCTIPVTFHPTGSGTRTATVQITDNATGSPQSVQLVGSGTIAPSISGNQVHMGTVIEGQNETITVTVSNIGQVPITVGTLSISGSNLTVTQNGCTGTTLAPGGSCSMTLQVAGSSLGQFSDSVSIVTDPSGGLQPVDVSGEVIPAL